MISVINRTFITDYTYQRLYVSEMPGRNLRRQTKPINGKAVDSAREWEGKACHDCSMTNGFDVEFGKIEKFEDSFPHPVLSMYPGCEDGSPSNEDSPASDIGDYVSYLYQPPDLLCANSDVTTILPVSLAPPAAVSCSHTLASPSAPPEAKRCSQPNTPPREGRTAGANRSSNRTAAVAESAMPGQKTTRACSSRKRKTPSGSSSPAPAPAPIRSARVQEKLMIKGQQQQQQQQQHQDHEEDSDSDLSDRGGSPCLAMMHDSIEVRPEDDPLGLFRRDPSTLNTEEQRLVKKQRRLLKNRESAQLSRHRKKMHLTALERQVPSRVVPRAPPEP